MNFSQFILILLKKALLLNIILDNQKIEKGEQIIKLNAYGYKPGLYMINLTIGGKTYSRRFLIEN